MMDFEDYLELGAIHTINEPDEINPWDDPYWEDQATIEEHLDHEAYLEAHISSLYGEEVKL